MNIYHQVFPLILVNELIPNLKIDLKYATHDNFMGRPARGYLAQKCYLSKACLEQLLKVNFNLNQQNLGMIIYDGYRPHKATLDFLDWCAGSIENLEMKKKYYPNLNKSQFFELGFLAKKSRHSSGSAVDLSLYYLESGELIDMGGFFDFFHESSATAFTGISKLAQQNRMMLKNLMEAENFTNYHNEWWHYSLKNEPHEGIYFDEVIKD